MPIPAWLLGDPAPLPFLGHARVLVEGTDARLTASARLGVGGRVTEAFRAARALEATLRGVAGPGDRNALLWRAWSALFALDRAVLGPAKGADLTLLMLVEDARGAGVAGVGLSGVWGLSEKRLFPLAEGAHPLLAPPGLPTRTPGVLTLDSRPEAVIGRPHHFGGEAPAVEDLAALAGVRS